MSESAIENQPIEPEKKKRVEGEDVVALVGLTFLVSGIFWIYKPAALITLGVLLLVYAFALQKKNSEQSSTPSRED